MSTINWKPAYSVGVKIIDDQHKQLVSLINQAAEACKQQAASSEVKAIIAQISEYMLYHFTTEEAYFTEWNYPQAQEHIKDHERFTTEVFEFQKKVLNNTYICKELLTFLTDWFQNHVIKYDKQLTMYFSHLGLY